MGQTSESLAFLFLQRVSRYYPVAPLFLLVPLVFSFASHFPWLKKSAQRGVRYYAWHGCRGRGLNLDGAQLINCHIGSVTAQSVCVWIHVAAKLLNYANQQLALQLRHTGLNPCGNDLFCTQSCGGTMNWIRVQMTFNEIRTAPMCIKQTSLFSAGSISWDVSWWNNALAHRCTLVHWLTVK